MDASQGRRRAAVAVEDVDLVRDVAATTTAVARISQAALAIKNIFNNQLTDDGGMPSGCGG
jgi:hypothetical protein